MVNRPLHSGRICRACAALLCACATLAAGVPNPAAELIEHGQVAMRSDPEVSRADADRALALLARQPDPDLEIKARLLRCDYFAERDRRAAEKEAALAMALLPQAARKGLAAGVLVCQGEILETVGENDQARSLYEQAVMAATETGDDEMLALSLYQRGYMLGLNGDYASGLTDLDRAKKLYETLGEPAHALTALGGIAILYNRLGDYAEARRIYTHTLKAQQAAGLEREQAVTLHNLGRAHENLGEWGAASQAFAAALEIAKRIDYPRGEAYALRGLGAVANAQNSPRRALRILARAQVVQAETPDARLKARIALARGIAQRATGDYVASIKSLDEAVRVFTDADAVGDLAQAYEALAKSHAAKGDWQRAYEFQERYKETSDTLFNRQLDQRFATLKVQFDTAAREQENALLVRENEASERALAQERKAIRLQAVVIVLIVALAGLLATLALRERRTSRRLRTLAMTDELTGVPNRRDVLRHLDSVLARPDQLPCSILIIDVDHFKRINDTHGHPVGDQVLKIIAAELRAVAHPPATIGRLGGEEFIVVLPDTNARQAFEVAERMRERVHAIDLSDCYPATVTASVGIATSQHGRDAVRDLLRRADAALYDAKNAGRNCVRSAA